MRVSSFLAASKVGIAARKAAGAILPRTGLPEPILAAKLSFVLNHLSVGVLMSLLTTLCLAISFHPYANPRTLAAWVLASLALTGVRLGGIQAYHRQTQPGQRRPFWRRSVEGGAFVQGVLWALATTLLFPPAAISQFMLISVAAGLTGGAIIFLAPHWPAYVLFLLPTLLPLTLRLLLHGTRVERTLGALALVYTVGMLLASARTARWVEDALIASRDKDDLAQDLIAANQALQDHRSQLEATVLARTLELSRTNFKLQDEMKLQEQERLAAAQAERRYRALFDAVSEGFTHVNVQEFFLLANPAAERIFGVPPGTLVGRSLKEFLVPEDVAHVEQETLKRVQGLSSAYTLDIVRPDGARRCLAVNVSPVYDTEGAYAGSSGVFQDVTEQKRNEETLRQAQKLESMGVLAGGIAHDFNNLLSAIMGNLNLLQLETPTGSRSMQLLTTMEAATNRAASLTRQMLAYSGRGRFQIRDLDLNDIVGNLSELLQVGIAKGMGLQFDLAPELPAVAADPSQMQQVIMNLVTNASEAMDGKGGGIHLSTRAVDLDAQAAARASVHAPVAAGPHVVLQVRDEGSGIDPEDLPHIFDPFFTTRESGRGLGLSAMLGILRGHGAGLELWSRPGQGSTFTLYFPVAARPATAPAPPPTGRVMPFSGKVLAVDDEPAVLETVTIMLERMGFQVLAARDGVEALATFRAHADSIGLVLLDLTMPRMDGQETFQAIRGLKAHLPMILSSGYDAQQTMHHLQGPGAPTFLQKPYTLKVLRQTIETALGA